MYRLELTHRAQRELDKLGGEELEQVVTAIQGLKMSRDLRELESLEALSTEFELATGESFTPSLIKIS